MDTKSLVREANQAVSAASYCPKKLTALHTGISAAASLLVALLTYLLSTGIGDTAGLGGIGTRAALETAQSLLKLALSILAPFWALGFVAAALHLARRQEAAPRTLLNGFRRWGPALRLLLLEGVIYFAITFAAIQLGSFLYMMTPFSTPLNQLLEQLAAAGTADTAALTQMLLELDPKELMGIFWTMIPFLVLPALALIIPVSYRLRLAQYILMDEPPVGALFAIVLSFRLMKNNCVKLFRLDLRFWWFYALEVLVQILCYGDLLLPLVGVKLGMDALLASFLFYALALIGQAGLYVWQKPQVFTSYALFYDGMLPKEQPAEI